MVKKLELNYDVIDKAYEAQGMHNVRRWFRVNKVYNVVAAIVPATHLTLALSGLESPEVALIRTATSTSISMDRIDNPNRRSTPRNEH